MTRAHPIFQFSFYHPTDGNIVEESDADIRALMKRSLNQLRVEQKSVQDDLETAKKQRQTGNVDIRDSLDLVLHARHILSHGSPDQKRRVIHGIGSNWKIQDRKLLYEEQFVPSVLRAAKQKYSKELARFEPRNSMEDIGKSLRSDLVSTVWSGIRESNSHL